MKKDVLVAGVLGGAAMLVWLFVTNAVLAFKSNLMHRVIPLANQLEVHEVLDENCRCGILDVRMGGGWFDQLQ